MARDKKQHIDWSEVRAYWRGRRRRWEDEMTNITAPALPHFSPFEDRNSLTRATSILTRRTRA